MKKIKVGLFIDSYFPMIDGVVMVVDNYAKKLSKKCEVVVVCPSYGLKDRGIKFDYKVIRVKSIKIPLTTYTYGIPKMDIKILKRLVNEKFDIIHIHSPFSLGKLGIDVAKLLNIPVIGTMHTLMKFELYKYTKSHAITDLITNQAIKVYEQCDQCFSVNKKIGEIYKEYGYSKEVKIFQNATDLKLIENKKKSDIEINKLYHIKQDDIVFLFVGRITSVKNIMFIVDVLKILKDKKKKFKMLFVGEGPDKNKLIKKVNRFDLNNDVIMCGKITDRELLAKIYRRAKLFVFPSLFDTNSLVQIEASSQKTPTIFIENAPTAFLVTSEVNGFFGKNNPKKFAKKIIDILNDEKHYNEVSENAHKDLYKTWDTIAKEVYDEYIRLINK
ncbi:MAG: glycosyltransferase family 4 protein [Tenericutes bacterium]|nr:glycosyltransferase family 4 protein [Mycoplasmatota bacterium]